MFNIKQLLCQHTEKVISEKTLEYEGGPVEVGGHSATLHVIAMHAKTHIQTIQCTKCTRIRHKRFRHSPVS